MRDLIFELGRDPLEDGLVDALARHASRLGSRDGLTVDVKLPAGRLALSPQTELQLFAIAREALANVVKHSGASTAWLHVANRAGRVVVEIGDDGCGFDPGARHPGHFGLESMRSRAAELGTLLTITSTLGQGTVVRAEAGLEPEGDPRAT
jgi:signal transduction histidine kinase